MGFVYLLKSAHYYKIGKSEDVEARIKSLQTSTPHKIQLIHKFRTNEDNEAESLLHKVFKNKGMRSGEWFNLTGIDIYFICSITGFEDGSFTWSNVPIIPPEFEIEVKPLKTYKAKYYDDIEILVLESQIAEFLKISWQRQQTNTRSPFARSYWCKYHSPPFSGAVYEGIIAILMRAGIIINRRHGAVGILTMPPDEAMIVLRRTEKMNENHKRKIEQDDFLDFVPF